MVTAVTSLDRLTVEPVDIELPEACPECGQDFSEPSSLVEIGYMATRRTCQLVSANGVTVVSDHETAEVTDELAYANRLLLRWMPEGAGAGGAPSPGRRPR